MIGAIFMGCNPLEDVNNEIKDRPTAVVGSEEYTLTADDYSDLGLGFGSFDSEDQAKSILPSFLADMYPYWGQGSSVLVGYKLYIGAAEGVSDYTGTDVYTLTNSDYALTGSDAFGFYPNVDATSKIPDVLAAQIANPTEGQIELAAYKQYTETPMVGLADIVSYNFSGSFEGWTIEEEFGNFDVWTSGSGYVQGNGYPDTGDNKEWLVSPSIDLSGESNLKLQINQSINYTPSPFDSSLLKVLVSTDYAGDVMTATWNEINFATAPTSNSSSYVLSEDYDFSAYDGQTINIAFSYENVGTTNRASWRIASLAIKTLGATGPTDSKGEYFMYSGSSWSAINGVYYLSSADYNSMGTGSGQPGQYDNFSSSLPADDYITTFLSLASPYAYAQDDAEIIIVYKYYSSTCSCTQTRGNLYTVVGGEWTAHQTTIATTLQFGFDNGAWVPDNTIRYTLTNADYEYIGATLASDPEYTGIVGTLTQYHDYDYNWSEEQIIYSLGVLLDHIDPNAAEGQKYLISYLKYDNGLGEYTAALIKTGGEWVSQ
ncbi:MAG TPA: choice-of-anchor J domain-containing protein [Flavobacteriaceae bacterium]